MKSLSSSFQAFLAVSVCFVVCAEEPAQQPVEQSPEEKPIGLGNHPAKKDVEMPVAQFIITPTVRYIRLLTNQFEASAVNSLSLSRFGLETLTVERSTQMGKSVIYGSTWKATREFVMTTPLVLSLRESLRENLRDKSQVCYKVVYEFIDGTLDSLFGREIHPTFMGYQYEEDEVVVKLKEKRWNYGLRVGSRTHFFLNNRVSYEGRDLFYVSLQYDIAHSYLDVRSPHASALVVIPIADSHWHLDLGMEYGTTSLDGMKRGMSGIVRLGRPLGHASFHGAMFIASNMDRDNHRLVVGILKQF